MTYEAFCELIAFVDTEIAWGPVVCWALVGVGVFLTIFLKGLPFKNLIWAFETAFTFKKDKNDKSEGDISPFQSLMTSLSATIGTGNIAGVAGAMAIGGPGAIVWMWIAAVFGLSTKYAESMLGVKYRQKNAKGEMAGGPMYAMREGFKNKKFGIVLAALFSVFAVGASFGIGNIAQANTIADAINTTLIPSGTTVPLMGNDVGVTFIIVGAVLTVCCILILLGGIQRIGKVCGILVPFMAAFYIIGGITCIINNAENLPEGLHRIFTMAFSTQAVAGGGAGMLIQIAIQKGISRGVFSNESGLGSAPIAAAAAKTDSAEKQGYISMTGTFIDTMIVCTITGLVVASSGLILDPDVSGINIAIEAFNLSLGPVGGYIVAIGIIAFAFSTILGWEYYGEKSLEYLTKSSKVTFAYRIIFSCVVFFGCVLTSQLVWDISDMLNGFMAIPNLICLMVLCTVIRKDTLKYQSVMEMEKANARAMKKRK